MIRVNLIQPGKTDSISLPASYEDMLLVNSRRLAALLGPLLLANDDRPDGLAGAQANAELLLPGWCQCSPAIQAADPQAYWRRPDGAHGWMCTNCRRITQVG